MAFQKSYNAPLPVTQPQCKHLRSKGMFVTGDRHVSHPDESGSHHFWCNLTQHVIGPDQTDVTRCDCIPGRGCYCEM